MNTYKLITILFIFQLLSGVILTYSLSDEETPNYALREIGLMNNMSSFVESEQGNVAHLSGDTNYDKTTGSTFDISYDIWNIFKYGFGGIILVWSTDTLIEKLILIPASLLNALFGIYIAITIFFVIKNNKVD